MIDAYQKLFTHIDKDLFFKSSIEDIIYIEDQLIEENWEALKSKVFNNEIASIRGYGRDAKGTELFLSLYRHLFNNYEIIKDSTNNAGPTKLLKELTPFCKVTEDGKNGKIKIVNFQISHLFGRTKNPLLFCSPWNIAYIPKYLDPFTGHETQGDYSKEFKDYINPILNSKFKKFILDYNNIVDSNILPNLDNAFSCVRKEVKTDKKKFERFVKEATKELGKV